MNSCLDLIKQALIIKAKKTKGGGKLPSEYQQCEYIESSGTQYIDLDYVPNPNTEFLMDYQFLGSGDRRMGSLVTGGKGKLYIGAFGNKWFIGIGFEYNLNISGGNNNRHIFETRSDGFYVDDILKWSGSFDETEYVSIYLFGLNNTGQLQLTHSARCYEVKIFESGNLVKHFIPCYRKSDTEIGLYDLIGRQFYTNDGTGTFTKGGDS